MTFANAVRFTTAPGRRDELVSMLTRRSDLLAELGCRLYEVGVQDEAPDSVFVVELWTSSAAHRASLQHPEVAAAVAAARPLLAGADGFGFDVAGSPLRESD